MKILLVEDDKFLSDMYVTKFSKLGYEIETAYDGEEGIRKIKKIKPDIILLDIRLPLKNGFEVLRETKKDQKTKNIPVILLTNLGQKEDIEEGLKLGAVDYLIKAQFTPQEIVDKVKRITSKN
ncbi:response regulator [bacterium]|nr:MAG: response regulator [bacterium]